MQLLKLQTLYTVEGCNGKVKKKWCVLDNPLSAKYFLCFFFFFFCFPFVGELLMFRVTVQEELFLVVDVLEIAAPTFLSLLNVIT